VHAALLFALLHMSGKIDLSDPQSVLKVFDVTEPPLPPPAPPPPVQPRSKQGASAPKNIKSQATPVVAPKPQIQVPTVPAISATETPRQGTQTTQGSSDVRGPGTGAGGSGSGNGAGTGGDAIAERARLMSPPLSSRDFSFEMEQRLASGAAPFVIFTVLPSGRVTNCRIYQSSGDPALDSATCALVTSRFVYRPAFNRRGEAVASEMAYRQAQ
jgi:protein TonB